MKGSVNEPLDGGPVLFTNDRRKVLINREFAFLCGSRSFLMKTGIVNIIKASENRFDHPRANANAKRFNLNVEVSLEFSWSEKISCRPRDRL